HVRLVESDPDRVLITAPHEAAPSNVHDGSTEEGVPLLELSPLDVLALGAVVLWHCLVLPFVVVVEVVLIGEGPLVGHVLVILDVAYQVPAAVADHPAHVHAHPHDVGVEAVHQQWYVQGLGGFHAHASRWVPVSISSAWIMALYAA